MRRFLRDDRGSLSVLILSLFMTVLITLLILTDISAIYFAKRALTQATEAAAQRGVRNLDMDAYYSSKYNISSFLINLTDASEKDPGIPNDCQKGEIDALDAVSSFSRDRTTLLDPHLQDIHVEGVSCDGFQLSLRTSATARLPVVIPFTKISSVLIRSEVGTFDERKASPN